jgi:hypothetical protein
MRLPTRIALVLLSTVWTAHAQIGTADKPNMAGVELLGRGLILTANYERDLTNRVGAGAGLMYWSINDTQITIVPLYLSATPIGQTHRLYLAAGITTGFGGWGFDQTARAGVATAGYEYRARSGLVLRPAINWMFSDGMRLTWPGFMIGHRF